MRYIWKVNRYASLNQPSLFHTIMVPAVWYRNGLSSFFCTMKFGSTATGGTSTTSATFILDWGRERREGEDGGRGGRGGRERMEGGDGGRGWREGKEGKERMDGRGGRERKEGEEGEKGKREGG